MRAVVATPILRPDGSVLTEPGYDPSTRVFLAARWARGPIPTQRADALRALDHLRTIAAGLSITDPHFFAAWLAVLASSLARHAFAGPSPLFALLRDGVADSASLPTITALATQAEAPCASRRSSSRPTQRGSSPRSAATRLSCTSSGSMRSTRRRSFGCAIRSSRSAPRSASPGSPPSIAERSIPRSPRGWSRSAPRRGYHLRRSRAPRLGVDRAKVTAMVLTLLAAHPVEADDDPGDGATLHTWSARVEDSLVAVGLSRVLEAPPLDAVSHEPSAVVVRAFETLCARRGGAVTVRDLLGALDDEVRDALEALEPGVLRGARAPHRLGRLLLRIARSPVGGRRLSLVGSGALGNRWSVRACVAS